MSKSFVALRLIILLAATFLLTWGAVTHAYWLDEDHATSTINDLREYAPPSNKKDIFTIPFYDGSSNKMDDSTPILLPHSDYFIPADIINANLPIFGLFSHPATPAKDPLANLLYANLKLKKLLEEYIALQKSSIEYLGYHTSGTNHFKSLIPLQTVNNQKKSNLQANSFPYKPIVSYYSNFRNLQGKISHNLYPLMLQENVRQKKLKQPKIFTPTSELHKFEKSLTSLRSSQHFPGYISHYPTYQSKQSSPLTTDRTDVQEQNDTQAPKNHGLQMDASDNLGKFMISLREYIISHPLAFFIYTIISIFTLNFMLKIIQVFFGF